MSLTLRQLRYFVATAECGQVSQASINLAISQSAVTAAIKDLEQTVGALLFERSPHGMELTPAGRQLLSHAYDILAKVEEAGHLRLATEEVEGEILLATTYTVIGYFLPLHLERIRRLFPRIHIRLFELNREAIEEGLMVGRYDISVLLTSNLANSYIAAETLISSVRRLWVSAQHELLRRDVVHLRDVAVESYIMLTVDEAAHSSLKYWSSTPYEPRVLLQTSSVEAVRSMVANGLGVAILSDMVHRPWSLEGRRIQTINLHDPVPPMDVGLAWRANAEFTPAMRAFRRYFQQAFNLPGDLG
jgi:DNA-binding transcriptional LysR family regulator